MTLIRHCPTCLATDPCAAPVCHHPFSRHEFACASRLTDDAVCDCAAIRRARAPLAIHAARCAWRTGDPCDCSLQTPPTTVTVTMLAVSPTASDPPWQSDATGHRELIPDLESLVTRILDNQTAMLEMHAANLRSVEKLLTILNLIGARHE